PGTPRELADLARRMTIEPWESAALDIWRKAGGKGLDGDPRDLTQAGWGVIFAQSEPPEKIAALREALKPLLDLRREQTGGEPFYREYSQGKGYLPKDTKRTFL